MGYTTKDIAVITEPKKVSLCAAPNFVQFASKPSAKVFFEINIQINILGGAADIENKTLLRFTEPSGAIHAFYGTTDPQNVTGVVFFVSSDRSDTAENLREALLDTKWIAANFDIRIASTYVGNVATNGRILNIKSRGAGAEYNATITTPNNLAQTAYTLTTVHAASTSGDSISGEAGTAEIELDIYTGAALRIGEDDRITSPEKLGTLALTLQKTYSGEPLWFDVNGIFSQYPDFNAPLPTFGWFDTGTVRVFRFIARKKAVNSFTFYQSSALFTLSGYGYASENIDLAPYIYAEAPIKLLSNKPRTAYVKGQREYLNFLFSDYLIGQTPPVDFQIKVVYRAYTTADEYLGKLEAHTVNRADLKNINTCALNIDLILAAYPNAGIIRVALGRGAAIVSNDLEYTVRPQALHDLCQFVFLNRFGGWDAVNFDGAIKYASKPEIETFNKTLTPNFKKGKSLETVYTAALDDPRTVEGAPVPADVAEWLKEMQASRVILDGGGNYVIVEDFTISPSAAATTYKTPLIKYRLTETYTND